ncbi:anaphase-promoting complex subunit cdh1-like isoform X3 [Condylostylus longicornis]|nr:anaphase-promoting complex subunit cdh1-like isoform X2 [Condylostylus longicornis]XP_055378875.1 anaphase-promoting complex subunit cdh1-like isoform X3 [Condylostylus longicornis]
MLRSPTHLVGHGPTSSPHHMATTPNVHRLNFTTTTNNNNNNNNHNNNHLNGANTPTSPHVNGLFSNGSTTPTTPTTPTNNSTTTITTLFQKNNSTATSSSSTTTTSQATTRSSLFDSCHRKIRLIGGGPVAFLGGLVA